MALDVKHAVCNYSNFCRVIGTPEEVLLDLGLNENPTVAPTEPVAVTQRVVLNYFTAKRYGTRCKSLCSDMRRRSASSRPTFKSVSPLALVADRVAAPATCRRRGNAFGPAVCQEAHFREYYDGTLPHPEEQQPKHDLLRIRALD